jgi:hypothetical protein
MASMASKLLRLSVLPAAFAAGVVLAAPSARAQTGMVDGLLSTLGLRNEEKPDIDYRERAPLVVPPKMELRPPQESAAKATSAWPTDPDVVKKRKEDRQARIPRTEQYSYRMGGDKTLLSVDEMRAGRVAGAGLNTSPPSPFDDPLRAERFDPKFQKQLREGSKSTEKNQLVAGQEPTRNYLTDPPAGYRMPSERGSLAIPKATMQPKQSDNDEASPWAFWRRGSSE